VTKGRLFGADRIAARHRISVLGTCGAAARALAGAISTEHPNHALSRACTELATEARRLGDAPQLGNPPALLPGELDALDRVQPLLDKASDDTDNTGALRAFRRLSDALGLLSNRQIVQPTQH
jgi:hypothetical protein